MQMMVKAGFAMVFIGIETPSTSGLEECSKSQNKNRNLIETIKHIHASGLRVDAGFIVGFDSDSPSIFQEQIDFIQESGIVTAMVGQLQAIPGTKLYTRLEQEGRLHGHTSGDNAGGFTNFIPKMGFETLSNGHKYILQSIYSPENYIKRVMTFLTDYNHLGFKPLLKIRLRGIIVLFRVFYYLGVKDPHRKSFWKLLFWTRKHQRNLIYYAVLLMLIGYHYRKVNELINS